MVVLTAITLLILTSCSSGSAVAPPESAPRPTEPDRFGAPQVTNPRDIRGRADAPCSDLLTPGQLRRIGFREVGETQQLMVGSTACNWDDRDTEQALTLVPYANRDLLADTYRARLFALFQPTTVADLPAVREQSEPTSIACTVTVGIADTQALEVTYTQLGLLRGERPDDPCGRGERIAEVVIGNLPPLR